MAPRKKQADATIEVVEITQEVFGVRIVGNSPLIYNCMSQKAKRDLLFPPDKKEKDRRKALGILKHEPVTEYRESVYRFKGDKQPTRLLFPGGGMKKAIAASAIDLPGAFKAQIGRLVQVIENDIRIWGLPELFMSVVQQQQVPDIRTRAILPEWCAEFSVQFSTPMLTAGGVASLIAAAGKIIGIGDWRPQKGSGNYGTFGMVEKTAAAFARIKKTGGRKAQDRALEHFTCHDVESEELLNWFRSECTRREVKDPRVWVGDLDEATA